MSKKSEAYRPARRNRARLIRKQLRFEVGELPGLPTSSPDAVRVVSRRATWPEAWEHVQRVFRGSAGTKRKKRSA